MTFEKKHFFGCNAFLHRVIGKYLCDVWLWHDYEKANYDSALALRVDLSQTPSKSWATATVDDFVFPWGTEETRGLTSLGGHWPKSTRVEGAAHAAEAGIYLEMELFNTARTEVVTLEDGSKSTRLPEWPPVIGKDPYRFECIVLHNKDDGDLSRYYGFHAELTIPPNPDGKAYFKVYMADDVDDEDPKEIPVETRDPNQCHDFNWSNPVVGSKGPLYLRWEYAHKKGLSAGKLPFGLGNAELMRNAGSLREEPRSVSRQIKLYRKSQGLEPYQNTPHVSVSHNDPKGALREIQKCISDKSKIVDERWGLEAFLHALPQRKQGDQTLDLIAHSTARSRVLAFDGWQIEANDELVAFCERVRGCLSRFKELRLIGCATAATPDGLRAMAMLEDRLDIKVLGTTTIVYADSFRSGCYDGNHLRSATDVWGHEDLALALPPSALLSESDLPGLDSLYQQRVSLPPSLYPRLKLPNLPRDVLTRAVDIKEAWLLPGLLTHPLVEIIADGDSSGVLLADVLFDWRFLRVHRPNEPHPIFRIKDPEVLRAAVLRDRGNQRVLMDALRHA